MQNSSGGKITLERHNWELPALVSLVLAVGASLYAVTPGFQPIVAGVGYSLSLISGFISIFRQIQASKARIVTFDKKDWKVVGDEQVLEIRSDFMLFRVETRKDELTFQQVISGTETSEDGRTTRVCFDTNVTDEQLVGRIIIR